MDFEFDVTLIGPDELCSEEHVSIPVQINAPYDLGRIGVMSFKELPSGISLTSNVCSVHLRNRTFVNVTNTDEKEIIRYSDIIKNLKGILPNYEYKQDQTKSSSRDSITTLNHSHHNDSTTSESSNQPIESNITVKDNEEKEVKQSSEAQFEPTAKEKVNTILRDFEVLNQERLVKLKALQIFKKDSR